MSNIKELKDQLTKTHNELENLLYGVSERLRNSCFGGYIHGFYDEPTSDITKKIKIKTGLDIFSVRGIILSGDENLLKYHISIDERLLEDFKRRNLLRDPSRYQSPEFSHDTYNTSLDYGKDARSDFKKEFGNIPLTYLIKYLTPTKNSGEVTPSPVEAKEEASIYDPNDTPRDKLKKINKKISEILFDMKYNKFSILNILRQRYVFYGVGQDQQDIINGRIEGIQKNISQLFDLMDDRELLHHLNISVEMLTYLISIKNRQPSEKVIEERFRTIAVNEALVVCHTEGIKPIDYKNKPIPSMQKKIQFEQQNFFTQGKL